jgi:hypothetical protein
MADKDKLMIGKRIAGLAAAEGIVLDHGAGGVAQ